MSEIVNFPNSADPGEMPNKIDERKKQANETYYNGVKQHIADELEALNFQASSTMAKDTFEDLRSISSTILNAAHQRVEFSDHRYVMSALIGGYINSLAALFGGGLISPLTGADFEWEELPIPEGKKVEDVHIVFRDKEFVLQVESIQVNKRYPQVRRFNNDNRFAHCYNAIGFEIEADDENSGELRNELKYTMTSIRYIEFPYQLEHVNIPADLDDDGNIDPITDSIENIANEVYFDPQFSECGEPSGNLVFLPPIPKFLLESMVNLEEEKARARKNIEEAYKRFTADLSIFDEDDEEDEDLDEDSMTKQQIRKTPGYKITYQIIHEYLNQLGADTETPTIEDIRKMLDENYNMGSLNDESISMILEDIANNIGPDEFEADDVDVNDADDSSNMDSTDDVNSKIDE